MSIKVNWTPNLGRENPSIKGVNSYATLKRLREFY